MDGTLRLLGYLGPVTVEAMDLLPDRKKLSSAGREGRPATAEMLQFCADNSIAADIEVLPSSQVDTALDRLRRNDVRYRFVLDMSELDRRDGGPGPGVRTGQRRAHGLPLGPLTNDPLSEQDRKRAAGPSMISDRFSEPVLTQGQVGPPSDSETCIV
jgi:hypothetical protein